MQLICIVIAIVFLLFSLKLLGSPLLASLLATKFDITLDNRALPAIAVFILAVIVCVAKIMAASKRSEHAAPPDDGQRFVDEDPRRFRRSPQDSQERRMR